jgi:hypothetical protein
MSHIILSEQDAFNRCAEGLKMAADGARMLAIHQSDKAFMWQKMAEVYEVAVQSLYRLSAERAVKQSVIHNQ